MLNAPCAAPPRRSRHAASPTERRATPFRLLRVPHPHGLALQIGAPDRDDRRVDDVADGCAAHAHLGLEPLHHLHERRTAALTRGGGRQGRRRRRRHGGGGHGRGAVVDGKAHWDGAQRRVVERARGRHGGGERRRGRRR
eukprot:2599852-Prymnesium_polylepis.1